MRPNQPENEQKAKGEYTNEVRSTLKMMVEKAQIISKSVLNKINNVSHQQFKELSAFINAVDKNGRTALYLAALRVNLEIVQYLAEVGADVNIADVNGLTPLRVATQNGYSKVADYLMHVGASYYTDDKFNEINKVSHQQFKELSAFINAVDKNGRIELYLAAHLGCLELVQYLLAVGFDINIADVNGLTPLQVATQNGHAKVADYLIRFGASFGTS